MNRFFQWFNLSGVCLLAILCVVQWQANRRLNLRLIDLENERLQQTQALVQKDQTIQGNIADMNDFRDRLARSDTALKDAQKTVQVDDAKLAQLAAQRDGLQSASDALKASLEQWKSAVAARDAALKQADDQARKLAADRNDAVAKFNDLAARYNTAQKQLNQAGEDLKKLADDRNDVVAKFNDLANKYNDLTKELRGPPPATRP